MAGPLSDGSITLRAPRLTDAPLHHAAVVASLPEVSAWLDWAHDGYALDESTSFIARAIDGHESREQFEFMIWDENDTFLGCCGLNRLDMRFLKSNLGYWVRTDAAGKGIAAAATRLLARFGFEHLGLQRIEIIAAVDNIRSQRVAEKVGAVREGVLRNGIRAHGRNVDAVCYSLIPGDLS
jgi:RimJ/RimL family protein N-acetyltransferase